MIETLNVGGDEAEGRRPIEEKLNLTSFIIILLNLLWPVTRWIKEAFLLLSQGKFVTLKSMNIFTSDRFVYALPQASHKTKTKG